MVFIAVVIQCYNEESNTILTKSGKRFKLINMDNHFYSNETLKEKQGFTLKSFKNLQQ
jgi:hypothetical protein